MPKSGTKLLNIEAAPIVVAMTPIEAAAAMRISRVTLYRLLRDGELASYRQGRSRRISIHAITEYQKRLESADAWQQQQQQHERAAREDTA